MQFHVWGAYWFFYRKARSIKKEFDIIQSTTRKSGFARINPPSDFQVNLENKLNNHL